MDGQATFAFAAEGRDADALAAHSAELWAGFAAGDEDARAALKRDGLDPSALRLSGPHPFDFAPAPDGAVIVTARGADIAAAETRLDLFRIYFLRRLLA